MPFNDVIWTVTFGKAGPGEPQAFVRDAGAAIALQWCRLQYVVRPVGKSVKLQQYWDGARRVLG